MIQRGGQILSQGSRKHGRFCYVCLITFRKDTGKEEVTESSTVFKFWLLSEFIFYLFILSQKFQMCSLLCFEFYPWLPWLLGGDPLQASDDLVLLNFTYLGMLLLVELVSVMVNQLHTHFLSVSHSESLAPTSPVHLLLVIFLSFTL